MNNWIKIGIPVIIALLLVTATVGITMAVTGGNTVKQVASSAYSVGQSDSTQYAGGRLCSGCTGNGQGSVTADPDESVGDVYIPGGAKCPNCPGYVQGTTTTPGQPGAGTTTSRGGCCRR
ncbi:MAG: hypothetical protein NT177_00140 [Chloroflexi bacterium]|jgi:hypothetical protein|nr:hypothetical protein [Chloroflexota bacterium]